MSETEQHTFSYSSVDALKNRIADIRPNVPAYTEFPEIPGPDGRAAYGRIAFEGLPNTRDLGGLIGLDGHRVKEGLLLRSGTLGFFGTEDDMLRLRSEYDLRLDVDLRNDTEISENPDPVDLLPGVRYVHANILPDETVGITQEQGSKSFEELRRSIPDNDSRKVVQLLYPHFLTEAPGVAGYRALLKALVSCSEGAALWHCSVGRDRCGLASMLVETILGVSWADIENDYLATNAYAPESVTRDSPASAAALRSARDAVSERYGSPMGYITECLGISQKEIEILRSRYLE